MADEQPTVATAEVDPFLQHLVRVANETGIGFGITLHVGGLLVTGAIAGTTEYFDAFGDSVEQVFGEADIFTDKATPEGLKQIGDTFRKFGTAAKEAREKNPGLAPQFIHLTNARVYTNSDAAPIPTEGGVHWRGRISAVDGFSMGTLNQS